MPRSSRASWAFRRWSAAATRPQVLKDGKPVTVSCAEGDTGFVYRGILETEVIDLSLDAMPKAPVKITMNVGNPELAFEFQRLPNDGVGLARLEFIIARMIGVHPQGGAGLSGPRRRSEGGGRGAQRRLRRPGDVLCREARRGRRDAGRGVLAEAGDRAAVGLQVERVFEPHRRQALRAAGREPDARFPRRVALHLRSLPRLLRARMPGAEESARRDGPHQRRDHGAVRAHGATKRSR